MTETVQAKVVLKSLFAIAIATVTGSAAAQQQGESGGSAGKGGGKVITIGEVTIVGRVQKPIASVDVSKIQPRLALSELKRPFLDRIEAAVFKDPF